MTDFTASVIKGQPLKDTFIIDVHSHFGKYYNFTVPTDTAEGMLAVMDAVGIDIACISHFAAVSSDYSWGNDRVLELVRRYPDRFRGYCSINPHYPADMAREISRCLSDPGMIGIKIHPDAHELPIDAPVYHAVYQYAAANHCPILIHVWGLEAVAQVGRVSEHYPEAIIIMGHAGADVDAMREAAELANARENVYADLALSYVREGNVEWLVREMHMADKLLFGTDMPFFDPRPAVGRVALAEISDSDKEKIFGLNLLRLLKL